MTGAPPTFAIAGNIFLVADKCRLWDSSTVLAEDLQATQLVA